MRKVLLAGLTAFAMVFSIPTGVIATTVTPKTPFQTSTRPYIVALQPGVDITPIISTGDLIGGSLGGFQYTGRAGRDRRVPEFAAPTRGVHQPRTVLPLRRPRVVARVAPDAERCGQGRGGRLRRGRHGAVRVLLLLHHGHDRRCALVLHRRGVVRLAEGRDVDRDQRAHRARDRDTAVRFAEPRERRAHEEHGEGGDVPVGGLVPAALAGVHLLRRRLQRRDQGPRQLHRMGARRARATATRPRTTSPRARR